MSSCKFFETTSLKLASLLFIQESPYNLKKVKNQNTNVMPIILEFSTLKAKSLKIKIVMLECAR